MPSDMAVVGVENFRPLRAEPVFPRIRNCSGIYRKYAVGIFLNSYPNSGIVKISQIRGVSRLYTGLKFLTNKSVTV
jgi:hypothetical protein